MTARAEDLLNFILRSKYSLRCLDISRTSLDEAQVTLVIAQSPRLETLIATELKWRPVEDAFQLKHQHLRVRTQLLPHRKDLIIKRLTEVACLYDVDGTGISLLADAIYVGIKCDVIEYLIRELDIDVNKCGEAPCPWRLPYPTKYIEKFELLRSTLPFHQAVLLNKFDTANMLLKYGADPYKKTR